MSLASAVTRPPPAPTPSTCSCHSNAGGFELAIPCGKESCVDGTELTCSPDGKLTSGGHCGRASCVCKVSDPDDASVGRGDLELACGVSVCLNGTTVSCDGSGATVRGAACKN